MALLQTGPDAFISFLLKLVYKLSLKLTLVCSAHHAYNYVKQKKRVFSSLVKTILHDCTEPCSDSKIHDCVNIATLK